MHISNCKSWGNPSEIYARTIKRTRKRAEGRESQSFTTSTLLSSSLSVFWVTASWSEVNYSKRRRVLAFARYHQETHQLCRRRFLISLTQSSAPETVALTYLIEAHFRSNDTSSGFQRQLITGGSQRGLRPALEQIHAFTAKFDFYLYLQLMWKNPHHKIHFNSWTVFSLSWTAVPDCSEGVCVLLHSDNG